MQVLLQNICVQEKIPREGNEGGELTIDNSFYSFEEVENIVYLRTEFYRKPEIRKEMKLRICKTIILSIVVFASEIWTLGITEQKLLGG